MPSGNSDDSFPGALRRPGRRDMLKWLGIGVAAGIAGCSGNGGTSNSSSGSGSSSSSSSNSSSGGGSGNDSTSTQSGKRSVGGDYVVGDSTDAQTLNWIQVSDVESDNRINLTLDGSYTITEKNEVFPLWLDLTTDDKRVYTAKLRQNLKWGGDYGQMTAEDWVYTINNVFEAKDNWAGFTGQSDWQRDGDFVPVEKTGKYTFDIKLPKPDPSYPLKPAMWGAYCMPKDLLKKYVPKKDVDGLKKDKEIRTLSYAGNLGPYTYKNWKHQAEFVAERNDDYYMHDAKDVSDAWKGAPYYDSYTYKVIPEQSTRLSALKSGDVTATGLPAKKAKQFQGMDNVTVNVVKQAFLSLLIYNERKNGWKPFRKQSVRQALSYAVDKKSIVDNIERGFATVAHTFQPQFSEWYDDSEVVKTGVGDKYGLDKAKQKLSDALKGTDYGYDGDTLKGPDGKQVTLKLVYATGSSTTETTCQLIAQEYGKIGIKVNLKGVKFDTLLNKYVGNSYQGSGKPKWSSGPQNAGGRDEAVSAESWDMMYGIIFNTYPRTPASTEPFWEKDGSVNFFGYYPEADLHSLYAKAIPETDKQKRKQLFGKIFAALSKEQPVNFIDMGVDINAYQSSVQGPKDGESPFGFGWDSTTWYMNRK